MSTKYVRNEFEHIVAVKLIVNTAQLWESPRSYIWKHLGNNSVWTRGNGTEIRLSRIHHVQWFPPPSYQCNKLNLRPIQLIMNKEKQYFGRKFDFISWIPLEAVHTLFQIRLHLQRKMTKLKANKGCSSTPKHELIHPNE